MELKLVREVFTKNSTIGSLFIDNEFSCFILEDVVRELKDLNNDNDFVDAGEGKVYGETAIPYGRYEIITSFSQRFQKNLPLLLLVPGFEGVRIHPGNKKEDTHGCLLPGNTKAVDFVGESKLAFSNLFKKIEARTKKEKIFITITK